MSKPIEIHLTPENFPNTSKAMALLVHAAHAESLTYCSKHELPLDMIASAHHGLLLTMEAVLKVHIERAANRIAPGVYNEHFEVLEDGSHIPMDIP